MCPEALDDRVEVDLPVAVRQALAEQAMGVRDVRDLRVRPELLDIALELQAVR